MPLELIWVLLGVMWIVDVIEFGSGGGLKLGCVSVVLVAYGRSQEISINLVPSANEVI